MGISLSLPSKYDTKLYKWSSEEFHEEYALIYTVSYTIFPSRSCTFYYRVNPNKVVLSVDDGLCLYNRVKVNMVFVAEPDEKNCFKFRPVRFKESHSRYIARRRRSCEEEEEVLVLKYSTDIRTNVLSLHKKTEEVYKVCFQTGVQGHHIYKHHMNIHCNPSNGIDVNLSGPHRRRLGKNNELCDAEEISGMPSYDVIDNADDINIDIGRPSRRLAILKYLTEDGRNRVLAPRDRSQIIYYNTGNLVHNEGNFAGGNIYDEQRQLPTQWASGGL